MWTDKNNKLTISSNTLVNANISANGIGIYATACNSVTQYVKAYLRPDSMTNTIGIIFRSNAGATSYYYLDFNNFVVLWADQDDNEIDSAGISWTYFSTVGVTIKGTSNSTVIKIWTAPTADIPQSADEWDEGDDTPEYTLTNDGTHVVDTGNYIGFELYRTNVSIIPYVDNFFGGDTI